MSFSKDNTMEFSATYVPRQNGQYSCGVRLMPFHKALASPFETGLMTWG
ncbi:MAG: hypothetical protein LBV65_03050 [Desulfovibrio sp.]|nr:hypothetical protein [Desulfovibrio sp.]